MHYNMPRTFSNIFENHIATQLMSFTPRADMVGTDFVDFGEASVTGSEASYFGPAYMINHLVAESEVMPVHAVLINCHYPVSPDSFVLQYGVMVKRFAGMSPEESTAMAQEFGHGTMATFEQDIEIWRNKVRIDNPLLCEEDGPVYQLRRWYEQFYVDAVEVSEDMVRRFEHTVDTTKANEYWDSEVAENLKRMATEAAAE